LGILQPRLAVSLPVYKFSLCKNAWERTGHDPYTDSLDVPGFIVEGPLLEKEFMKLMLKVH
jgi:hypothetical protein